MKLAVLLIPVALMSLSGQINADDHKAEAMTAFKSGIEHFKNGRYREAADAFREANRLRPNWSLNFNIGQSEAAAKRYGLAYEAFEEYLAKGGDEVPEDRRTEVMTEIDRLLKMIGSVEVSGPSGATVIIDDVERGKTPLPGKLKVAAGIVHRLTVSLDDEVIHESTFKVSRGEVVSVDVKESATADTVEEAPAEETISEPDAPEPLGTEPSRKPKGLMVGGAVTAGIGGAVLIGGVVTGALALSKNSSLESSCDGNLCPTTQEETLNQRDAMSLSSTVLLSVGGVAATAGVVLLVLGLKGGAKREDELSLMPVIGETAAGFSLRGRF